MMRRFLRVGCAFALGFGLATLQNGTSAADDTKAPAKEAPAKAPDFSKYTSAFPAGTSSNVLSGEIIKADDKKVTLRITWFMAPNVKPNPGVRPPPPKEMHKDYDLEYLPESLVRTKVLPPKLDDKGKKVPHTTAELAALKTPPGVPNYVASPSDLVPGTLADVVLIREKTISAAKQTDEDLRVKYVIITGTKQAAPADPKKN